MPNALLTIDMVTRKALQLFRNTNSFMQSINRDYDSSFGVVGAKIGDTLRIRLPNDYTVTNGSDATSAIQSTTELSVSLPVATQKFVAFQFSSAERALKLDDYAERVLAPAVNNLAAKVAADIMSSSESICNLVANVDGSNVVLSPTVATWLQAGAVLDTMSAPRGDWKIVMSPVTQARTVNTMSGFFNPQRTISAQYASGMITVDTLGFDWMSDQTVINHTTGTFSAGGDINGADQTGTTITVDATTGTFKAGDIITIANVNSVNRLTKLDSGSLAQFVITADANNGATTLHIFPAITPPVMGADVAYQTVTASPADEAAVALVLTASAKYRKNFAFHPKAITMVTADLFLPTNGVIAASRVVYDSISMRAIDAYLPLTDQAMTRLDILYGFKFVRPEWAVVVCDAL